MEGKDVEIELDLTEAAAYYAAGAVVLAVLLFFGLVGAAATPRGRLVYLTPSRWAAVKLQRRVHGEATRLREDVGALRSAVERGRPSPVDAMMLAERVYAAERTGTSATAPARNAAIRAAEAVVAYAEGTGSRKEAVDAVNLAVELMNRLEGGK